jgi:hypothetical protein
MAFIWVLFIKIRNMFIYMLQFLELAYRTGKSFYLPKDKLNELKKELQEYQKEKYPELKHSLPKHGGQRSI